MKVAHFLTLLLGVVGLTLSRELPAQETTTEIQWIRTIDSATFPVPESPADPTEQVNNDNVHGPAQAFSVMPVVNGTFNSNSNSSTGQEKDVGVGVGVLDLRQEDLDDSPFCPCVNQNDCSAWSRPGSAKRGKVVADPPCPFGQAPCCHPPDFRCGLPSPLPFLYSFVKPGEASYAEYPWNARIFTADNTNNQVVLGLGVIIAPTLILTTARNLEGYSGRPLKVRVGEWDLATNPEVQPFKVMEFSVQKSMSHPDFNNRTFQNDLAALVLQNPIELNRYPNIRPACLVDPKDSPSYGQTCFVSGWGFEPTVTRRQGDRNVLKKVDVQVGNPTQCQNSIRTFTNNKEYYFDPQSFLCAGGVLGRGFCAGDEGTPLVCPFQDPKIGPEPRFVVIGLASWGSSCGRSNLPGIFTNLAPQINWIKSVDFRANQYLTPRKPSPSSATLSID